MSFENNVAENFVKVKQWYIQRFSVFIFGLVIYDYVDKFMLCAA